MENERILEMGVAVEVVDGVPQGVTNATLFSLATYTYHLPRIDVDLHIYSEPNDSSKWFKAPSFAGYAIRYIANEMALFLAGHAGNGWMSCTN